MHGLVHLLKGPLGLGEEVVDDGFAELALFFIVVHLEDLYAYVRHMTSSREIMYEITPARTSSHQSYPQSPVYLHSRHLTASK